MDLSQPRGSSINEYISKEEFSVKYTHFDEATALVQTAGRSSLLSKVDIIPVAPGQTTGLEIVRLYVGGMLFYRYQAIIWRTVITRNI